MAVFLRCESLYVAVHLLLTEVVANVIIILLRNYVGDKFPP